MTRAPTTAKLRYDIDRGLGSDKVAALDPAAAPLGTDDEAAGTPPSPEAVQLAHQNEIRVPPGNLPKDNGFALFLGIVIAGTLTVAAAIALL